MILLLTPGSFSIKIIVNIWIWTSPHPQMNFLNNLRCPEPKTQNVFKTLEKVTSYHASHNLIIKNWGHKTFFWVKELKAKIEVLTIHTVAMVTFFYENYNVFTNDRAVSFFSFFFWHQLMKGGYNDPTNFKA